MGPDYKKEKREDKSKPERQKVIGSYFKWEKVFRRSDV